MISNISNVSILKNITILYAEDEAALREITLNILRGFTKKQFVAEIVFDVFRSRFLSFLCLENKRKNQRTSSDETDLD